ncbi:preATP grasp domain-containing protein [Actinophytocola xanthii]|uniref:ATP-grasp domain-containing protein n=1 Tax=Actinophytocola xanthii TaxID=1912961 RepID=A0A1Q8C6H4_9PSEU|nr:peptide ligase PGM1-related protein [Actinophytocola xanthii]OLF09947.1 hypothetical protein BU204_32465 [Actinophytocola xanthii]
MTALVVGNSRTEEMVGDLAALSPDERRAGGCAAQRVLWFAGTGDVVVLPQPPDTDYLAYVADLTRVDPSSLTLLVPPPGRLGAELLTPDRLADPAFRAAVGAAVRENGVDHLLAVYKDVAIAEFARAVGLGSAVPGLGFSAQGGDALVNSKAVFRAVATGADVPIAPGRVVSRVEDAAAAITEQLTAGHCVMLKQEFAGGGFGNEILSPAGEVRAAGAPRVVTLPDAAAVEEYLARRWDWLSDDGRHRLVVERYLLGCDTVYGEYLVGDGSDELLGTGEILMEPVAVGEVVPAQGLSAAAAEVLETAGRRLCRSFAAMGYRGFLSTDAVLTPAGEIVFTETNGRVSGSTHLHIAVRAHLVADAHRANRVLLERSGWAAPSFLAARERLDLAGLGYDADTSTGVVLISGLMPDDTLTYCVLARDLTAARAAAHRVEGLFAEVGVAVDRPGRTV